MVIQGKTKKNSMSAIYNGFSLYKLWLMIDNTMLSVKRALTSVVKTSKSRNKKNKKFSIDIYRHLEKISSFYCIKMNMIKTQRYNKQCLKP